MSLGRWFRDHPRSLEDAYRTTLAFLERLSPWILRSDAPVNRITAFVEHPPKALLFDCQMCGQCTLHGTGMTCPMTCPKNIRNGPCGGVRANGHCEVKPEMKCIWVEAYSRNLDMRIYAGDFSGIQPPLNRQLSGTSAWINLVEANEALPAVTGTRFLQPAAGQDDSH